MRGSRWIIGDGKDVCFWLDQWIPGLYECLKDLASASIPNQDLTRSVRWFTTTSGDWDWQKFDHFVPADTVRQIAAILPPQEHAGPDKLVWGFTIDG